MIIITIIIIIIIIIIKIYYGISIYYMALHPYIIKKYIYFLEERWQFLTR